MLTRRLIITVSLLAASLTACGEVKKSSEAAVAVDTIAPDNIKSNYSGDVTVTGHGFDLGSVVLLDGTPASDYPGVTFTIVDTFTIQLHIAYSGPGHELNPGDRDLVVRVGLNVSEQKNLHVRPLLTTAEHVRSLPVATTLSGGTVKLWVRPFAQGVQIRPGHELAGEMGLGATNFRWDNVRFWTGTTTSNGTPVLATTTFTGAAAFDPVNDIYPLAVAMAIDQSGSMDTTDPTDLRITAAQEFVTRLGGLDEMKVLKFQNAAVDLVMDWSADKVALTAALETLRNANSGATPLYDSMMAALAAAQAHPNPNAVRAVVILTDGKDTSSAAANTPQAVIDAARNAGVPIFTIGLGDPNDPASLDKDILANIANQTGGLFFFGEDAGALGSIFTALNDVLTSSYLIEGNFTLATPLPASGIYTIEGDIVTLVDGETVSIPMAPLTTSFVP